MTDQRIQSLLREKDAEILKLRDQIFSIEKGNFNGNSNVESYERMLQVVRDENMKLKNELSALRVEKGSVEIMQGLRDEIHDLQRRNL